MKTSGTLNEKSLSIIEKIYSAAYRMSKIIRNLLEYSRKKPVEFREHDLNDIVEKTSELKEYEFYVDNIDVGKDLSSIPFFSCDITQIQQVLLNFLNNAHHAIKAKGERKIISLQTYSNDKNIYIEISDTGIGMPEEIVNRIFDPFYTKKDVGHGTGLGLSIVYSAVKAHGGEIKVRSTVGEGSTFIVSLPLNLQTQA